MERNYEDSALFEHQFWLKVLSDHAQFLLDALAPKEKEDIKKATYFVELFTNLLNKVRNVNLVEFSKEAEQAAKEIRMFKLNIIQKQLEGKITIHFTPTFINHMVNEVEEYITVLEFLKKGEVPPVFHELHYHLVWLTDAAGHAGSISGGLDLVEKRLKEKSEEFTKHFEQFYLKAVEMTGYLRTELHHFPALKKFTKDVSLELKLFSHFLHEVEELELSNEVLSTLSARMADHMAREECYYLLKLAQSSGLEMPKCNPL
ncbi:DUF2935 domain-containing protein [Bacillus pacificus]|uniref:DUF2935 domain-containing protein n=1 Tax=Bacillus TaxID=1386 RepID=UPI000345E2E9|nr:MULTISPECIES: DUF2935 domain-containing protein [Bacillus cereus group]MCC2417957.1 DUF2935 domain-containing protein [Bacillus pacificus]MCU5007848.1 DUF2935 domain-containing protein [Bacillus pacificus]MCU5257904.1 DUF2935 domain-containing protein [Bacillus pacificus]MCU5558211.1 DUF2935 domain-containing protein [Bacillus pacificus]MDA2140752.1 DUF2935 domain-containing protein [Bacillus cereus group sp. Bc256]